MDRFSKFVFTVIAICLSLIAVENMGVRPAAAQNTSQTRTVMNQWEYWSYATNKSVFDQDGSRQLRDNLAKAGRDGWELVSVTEFSGALLFYFKRPLK